MVEKPKRKRDQAKCSECRRQRVKCSPHDRDWVTNKETCENCDKRGLDCGPNFLKKDDPVVNLSRVREGSNEPTSSSSAQQTTLQSLHQGYPIQDDQYMETTSHERKREERPSKHWEERSLSLSSEEIKEKLRSKFKRLNAVGTAWVHVTNGAPTHCGDPHAYEYERTRIIPSKFKEEFHMLVIKLFSMIVTLDSQEKQDLANGQMLKLLLTLQKYPGLCDDQKRGVLSDMALLFHKNGDLDEYQYILGMIADMVDPPIIPINQDACDLLATSILESDGQVLTQFWKKHFAKSNMPSDQIVPPPQRAAQHRNPRIADIILSRQKNILGAPAISNLESVHIAAAMGNVDTLSTLIDNADGRNVDARDAQKQTPLFLAAANGRQDCCELLLHRNADPNSRDRHGHTIVEVAAKIGNLKIIKMLVEKGANLHSPVVKCASTPLQAAIESGDPSGELVQYLIVVQKVDVSAQRVHDKETAMSLAQGRGLQQLVLQIDAILREQQPPYFRPY